MALSLFSEYAVTPDVFNKSCYKPSLPSLPNFKNSQKNDREIEAYVEACANVLCDNYFRQLREVFLSKGIVRDLRDGEWQELFSSCGPWHPNVGILLADLKKNGRLVPSAPKLPCTPKNDREWCKEALDSHKNNMPLNGIIVSNDTKNTYRKNSLVESVKKLSSFPVALERSMGLNYAEEENKLLNVLGGHLKITRFG